MFLVGYKILLFSFAAVWMFSCQSTECALLPTCGKPPPVTNAFDRYQSTNFGDNVTYVCKPGYTLFGESKRTCQANGKWDGVEPHCFKTCSLPHTPSSMYIVQPENYNRTYRSGEMIILACKKGLTKQRGSVAIKVCIEGDWTQSSLKCEDESNKRCNNLLRGLLKNPPKNTKIFINVRLSKARYRCRKGYELVGKEWRTCKQGRWTETKEPKCTNFSSCGESPVDLRAQIVGGSNSRKGWWPWQIGIYRHNYDVPPKPELICGGALISSRWILTAANCFQRANSSTGKMQFHGDIQKYLIKGGDHNLLKKEKSQREITPERIYVHPESRAFLNDIALVKLGKEVKLGKFLRTVCLPKQDEGDLAIPKKYGIVTGWGATKAVKPGYPIKKADRYSKVLKYSAYTIQPDQICTNRSVLPFNSTVVFCAGDGKGGNDTCHGDGGNAFVREARRGDVYRWVVAGLVSWGNGCAQKDEYTYYTRVYPFIDWVKKTMDEN